jgi:hypothetical protein
MATSDPRLALQHDLETALARYLADGHQVLLETVSRFFAPKEPTSARRASRKKATQTQPKPRIVRRNDVELGTIGERIVEALRASPGSSTAELASALSVDKAQLLAPMLQLRAQGRVRKVGERTATRYFPTSDRNAGQRAS